jgi:NADH-quinone oxidoreductase subunit L
VPSPRCSWAFLGIIQNDIKRVVAYSTLSQLGYMTVALGASAYSVAVFHLMTHAFFKALLFLAAGSVIMGMHHNQDIRWMGGLRKYMPITWITSLLGSLALIGTPLFSGFYSKDSIIEAVHFSNCRLPVLRTLRCWPACSSRRSIRSACTFLVFHGKERFDQNPDAHHDDHGPWPRHDDHHEPHESPWVVTVPLVLLAIPSVVIGFMTIQPMLFGDFFKDVIFCRCGKHPAMANWPRSSTARWRWPCMVLQTAPFWLALAGVALSYYMYMVNPGAAGGHQGARAAALHAAGKQVLHGLVQRERPGAWCPRLGTGLWKGGDQAMIDGAMVNGSWKLVGWVAGVVRRMQSGYLYHYALVMILGVFVLMTYFVWLNNQIGEEQKWDC